MTTICKNCNQTFEGNFCNNCGQTANTHEINFKGILHELQHSVLHIDKGILYTTKELFRRPGHTIRDYLNGQRVKHFKPFAYVLILSTIYTIASQFLNNSIPLESFLSGVADGADSKPVLIVGIIKWIKTHYAYTTLFTLPFISLASYLSFIKAKYNYFQHLILNSFIAGQQTVAYMALLPFVYFVKDRPIGDTINSCKFFIGMVLTFWTYFQFFSSRKPYKRILLTILSYIVIVVIFLLMLIVIIGVSEVFIKDTNPD